MFMCVYACTQVEQNLCPSYRCVYTFVYRAECSTEGRDFATPMVPQETLLCVQPARVRACYILLQLGDACELESQM